MSMSDWNKIEQYKESIINDKAIASIWSTQDVESVDDELTDDEKKEVLYLTERYHNAEVGINWEVLQVHIWDVKQKRGKTL